MTLKEWLSKCITGPHKIVAVFLLGVWSVFAVRSYMTVESKQHTYVKQTADLLSIAVHQQNRVMAESLLETLLSQGEATSAEVCSGDKQEISANQNLMGCKENAEFYENIIQEKIPGSGSLTLRARFNIISNLYSVLAGLGFALILVFCGFYFIQTAQNRIKKDLLDPLLNKLLGNDELEIKELMDLRETIKEAKVLEAQKAVTLAIQENNQQVAHDIRSPIDSINALLKMVDIKDKDLKAAFEKAVLRANSVANFLLKAEKKSMPAESASFDLASVVQDIAIEKRPLFIGGEIQVESPKYLYMQSLLSAESISRILSNIVDNAIQASDHDRRIKIKISHTDGFAEISIQDSGRGISKEVLSRMGEKGFSQRSSDQPTGTGRGVYSAKMALEDVGGNIQFSSTLGSGTTVLLRVPATSIQVAEKLDLILIENEEMHRLTWRLWARKNAFQLQTFPSAEDFLNQVRHIEKSVPIFLDFNLDDGKFAKDYIPQIRSLGFKNIILVTSHKELANSELCGVQDIIGKDPAMASRFITAPFDSGSKEAVLDLA